MTLDIDALITFVKNLKLTFKEHIRKNLVLALPVMITQAGQISVNIIDTIMVGGLGGKFDTVKDDSLSKLALAATSLGNSLFFAVLVFAFGFSFALSPLVAAEDSKGDKQKVADYFSHSLILNVSLATFLFLLLTFLKPILYHLKQPRM